MKFHFENRISVFKLTVVSMYDSETFLFITATKFKMLGHFQIFVCAPVFYVNICF